MDVVQTLSWFDKWFARHHHKCGVARLDMSILERGAGETKVKLTCPMCGNVISGTFQDEDMQHVDALLSDARARGGASRSMMSPEDTRLSLPAHLFGLPRARPGRPGE